MKYFLRLKTFLKSKKAKPLKWVLYVFSGLFFLILVLIIAIYFLLKSGSLTEKGVMSAKPYLVPLGIELSRLDSLKLDAFNSLSLKNLHVTWTDSEIGKVNVALGSMDAHYSFSDILDNKLTISNFNIENLLLSGDLVLDSAPVDEVEEASPMLLSDIEEILKSPPLIFNAQNMSMNNIDIDLNVKQDDISFFVKTRLKSLQTKLDYSDSQLSGEYAVDIGRDDGFIKALLPVDGIETSISFNPLIMLSGNWDINNKNSIWSMKDSVLTNEIRLNNISLIQKVSDKQENKKPSISLDVLKLNLDSNIAARNSTTSAIANTSNSTVAGKAGLENLFPIEVSTSLKVNWDKLKSNNFNLDTTRLTAETNNSLDISSLLHVDKEFMVADGFEIGIGEKLRIDNLNLVLDKNTLATQKMNLVFGMLLKGKRAGVETDLDFETNVNFVSSPLKYTENYERERNVALVTPKLSLKMFGETKLNDNYSEKDIDKLLGDTEVNFSQSLALDNVSYKEKNKNLISLKKLKADVQLNEMDRSAKAKLNIAATRVDVDGFKKRFSFGSKVDLALNSQLTLVDVGFSAKINRTPFLNSKYHFENKNRSFSANYSLDLSMPSSLDKTIPDLKDLYDLGLYKISKQGELLIKHEKKSIIEVDFEKIEGLKLSGGGGINVHQLKPPRDKSILITKPLKISYKAVQDNGYLLDVDMKSKGIKVEPLLMPIPFEFEALSKFDWPLSKLSSKGNVNIGSGVSRVSMLDFDIGLKNRNRQFFAEGKLLLNAKPEWDIYIADLADLREFGAFGVAMDFDTKLLHKNNTILELDTEHLENIVADVNFNSRISQFQVPENAPVKLEKPMAITQKVHWEESKAELNTRFDLREVLLPGLSKISLDGSLWLKPDNGLNPNSVDLNFKLNNGGVALAGIDEKQNYTDLGAVITPADFQLSVSGLLKDKINLDKFQFDMGRKLVSINASGSATIDGKNADVESLVSFKPYKNMLSTPLLSGSGELSLPLSFSMLNGDRVSLTGAVKFDAFNFKSDDFSLIDADGRIDYEEEFKINNDQLMYAYLKQANPFQRVDFGRIQPFLDSPAVSIQKIEAGDIEAGPLLANMSISQNLLRLQQFNVKLFDGHVVGQFYLDTTPGAWRVGVLTRMTGVDLRKMFPGNTYVQATKYSPINMRTAFEFDVHEKLVEGRIDISKIKQDQLLQMLEFIDPEHIDTQLSSLRSALGLAHPESVHIEMQQGLMNLEVSLSALPKPIRVSGIPLSVMMQQFSEEILELEAEFPVH